MTRRSYARRLAHDVYARPGVLEELENTLALAPEGMAARIGCTVNTYTRARAGVLPVSGKFIASTLESFGCKFDAIFTTAPAAKAAA